MNKNIINQGEDNTIKNQIEKKEDGSQLIKPNPYLEKTACPYLKIWNDQTIRFGFPHSLNYCHLVSPPMGVTLDYQSDYCLNIKNPYWMCILLNQDQAKLNQEKVKELPFLYSVKAKKTFKWHLVLVFVICLIMIITMIVTKIDILFWMLCFELMFISFLIIKE